MKVKFYGIRGSVPVCEPVFQEFGGNTTCVQFTLNNRNVGIFDAGPEIRNLGKDLALKSKPLVVGSLSHFPISTGIIFKVSLSSAPPTVPILIQL